MHVYNRAAVRTCSLKSNSLGSAANVYESSWPGDNHMWPTFCQLSNFTTVTKALVPWLGYPYQQDAQNGVCNDALMHLMENSGWNANALFSLWLRSHRLLQVQAMLVSQQSPEPPPHQFKHFLPNVAHHYASVIKFALNSESSFQPAQRPLSGSRWQTLLTLYDVTDVFKRTWHAGHSASVVFQHLDS